jgi:tetratricopeptide (TPR) repeat protein
MWRRHLILLGCLAASLRAHADGAAPTGIAAPLAPAPHKDFDVPDSEGAITIRPIPEDDEPEPAYLLHVDYLRRHHDEAGAIGYLEKVVTSPGISSRDRARAILELADFLQEAQRDAESLCWLKIWMQLYPDRREIGAVAFRVGTLYTAMGLPNLARDAYYRALSSAINQGQVQSNDDLNSYQRLTIATLWALAANEYQAGQWSRAAELLDRYVREAADAPPISLENAAFLRADCCYQLRQNDQALAAYEQALQQHPFNPLAPEARLRLYHLYTLKNDLPQAQGQLEALIWTVRTVCPKEELHWQQRTAETLLALHRGNGEMLAPLLAKSTRLSQGKAWQKELDHYDALVNFQKMTQSKIADLSPAPAQLKSRAPEQDELVAMERSINELGPARNTAPTP